MAAETNKETIAGMETEEKKENSFTPGEDPDTAGSETENSAKEAAGNAEDEENTAEGEGAGEAQDSADEAGAQAENESGEEDVVDGTFTQAEEGTKKSFFRRKKDKKDEMIEELNDRVKRQMAEFENFRKRTEKEKSQSFDQGARSVIEKILPVIDNFERGLTQAPESEDPFVQGMEKIYKSMLKELEAIGVKPIEAEGKEFDPNLHNAVMHVEDDQAGENIVVQELQKGYTYHGTVVRHSMVKVAN